METHQDPRNLIVNYIPTPVTEEDLEELFRPFGPLVSVRIICDRENGNHPKGYGFVRYKFVESAMNAMSRMNGYSINNKRLRVTQATGPRKYSQAAGSTSVRQPGPRAPPGSAPPKVSGPCFGDGAVEQISLTTSSLVPCPIVHPFDSRNSVLTAMARPQETTVHHPATFALVDRGRMHMIQAAPGIMAAPVGNQQFVQTVPASWAPALSTIQPPVVLSEGDTGGIVTGNIKTCGSSSPMELSVLSMTTQPVPAMTIPRVQQSNSATQPEQYHPSSKTMEPLCFQSYMPLNPVRDGILQGSVSSFFTPLGASDPTTGSLCGAALSSPTTRMIGTTNFMSPN
ncbi:RNA-binding protein, putative [Trypanosoma equiperdum]|uniref:RNA-binding protein, putative n=2 Tax=Trypanozoon TaxID=39700 RepID=Q57WI8_TRYB2|nr:RNA-binding protein, putative [Trypanosoma brucei brucei TREU927]AAX70033.1 RNA-binding protein, putative [Trypanosoma brucei]AAZ12437.1 RNA-binding protein, putative [Trypanosoma brucei brucei TREU927]SCU68412.1 RNA-binding protein, putative [Trypanosoma equiperdum]